MTDNNTNQSKLDTEQGEDDSQSKSQSQSKTKSDQTQSIRSKSNQIVNYKINNNL